jgi:hypothetical protein
MSALTNLWSQLVQRRLLPVAILLIAGLVAVPLLLAKDPDPVPPAPPVQVDTKSELTKDPIVTAVSADAATKRRKVLGARKNPFEVDVEQPDSAAGGSGDASGGTPTEAPKPTDTGGAETPGSSAPPSAPTPVAPTTPAEPKPVPKHYEPEELTVRFGDADGTERRSLQKLEALPSAAQAAIIYMGVRNDGKTAVFLLEAGVTADGDGECHPTPEQCETIRLREGETEFFDITDETGNVTQQLQLDLLEIHNVKKGATPSRTKSAGMKSGPRRTEARSVSRRIAAYLP